MARKRGKAASAPRAAANQPSRSTARATRSKAPPDERVSDVYQSMLAELDEDEPTTDTARPLKRRKVRSSARTPSPEQSSPDRDRPSPPVAESASSAPRPASARPAQTIEDSSDSDESEFEFEDVDLDVPADQREDEIEDVSVSLEPEASSKQQTKPRRRPVSIAEKSHRIFVHKLHIICLLQHCMFVNGRCNNMAVQRQLRSFLSPKVVSFLNPKPERNQFDRTRAFKDGLAQAMAAFAGHFRIFSSGLAKPKWESAVEASAASDYGEAVDRADFIAATKTLEGSQDLGNQLFCAMLRGAGVEARLVCSLQVLPFTNSGRVSTPQKPLKPMFYATTPDRTEGQDQDQSSGTDAAVQSSAKIGTVPSARRRLGQPSFRTAATPVPVKKTKQIRKLSYPVFWVEAFDAAHQKWIPVDPLVTASIGKASKFEPPSSYNLNQMTYVIAFESSGVARDVTKRYAKTYNAKTRRHRVEASGDDGLKWWSRVMRLFRRRGGILDRDQVEDAELSQKEAREGLPNNVQDFKDHPYYALERHLKRHEVIHPKREVGKVNAGTAANPRMEAVYRRQDVSICRSADKWYRLGRVIQKGEQPLKQVPARTRRHLNLEDNDEANDASNTTGLYAPYQTEQYVAPPVQRGRITKNAFGNLDLYVPSMVPAGGTHIRHALAQRAARLLKVDYADAVTGFQFKGRHGTAIIDGVVVATKYADAVWAAIEGFEDEAVENESRTRSLEALRLWKRFLVGLRIAERVRAYGDGSAAEGVQSDELDDEVEKLEDVQEAGGFLPGEADETPFPTAGQYTVGELSVRAKSPKRKRPRSPSVGFDDDSELASGPEDVSKSVHTARGPSPIADDYGGGGFLVDDNEEHPPNQVGGFVVDENADTFYDDDGGGGFIPEEGAEDGDDNENDNEDNDDLFGEKNIGEGTPSTIQEAKIEPMYPGCDQHAAVIDQNPTEVVEATEPTTSPTLRETVQDTQELKEQAPEDDQRVAVDAEDTDLESMVSHDPEDEDLEPDWLESD